MVYLSGKILSMRDARLAEKLTQSVNRGPEHLQKDL